MSDRRAVSAGHLAASSVAANEPWRVAVGGNRVQNMTVEQIAQAFAAGQLTVRTPLWPPGTSGWQALGNFEQFQSGVYAQPQAYQQLSSFEEADDDPTRMWTGSADLSELPGMEAMEPLPPIPAGPPPQQRPSARTGPRQVSTRAPASLPAPAPAARTASAAPEFAASPPFPPAVARGARPRRSSGLWLVAGLVGLVGLGSAVLAARGSWSVAAPADSAVASATPAAEPAPAAPSAPVPNGSAPSGTEPAKAVAAPPAEAPTAAAQPEPSANSEAAAAPPASEVNQARLAKYDEDTRASAFVAEGQPAQKKRKVAVSRAEPKAKVAAAAPSEPKHEEDTASAQKTAAKEAVKEKESTRVSSAPAKRASVAAAPAVKPHPAEAKEAKEVKEAKPEPAPVSSAVNDAAATALGNAAKLASSCRPRGGPAGSGKARVIYSNDGEVESVEILTTKFRDTITGTCLKMVFRRAKIPAFKGEPPTFIKSFTIPEE